MWLDGHITQVSHVGWPDDLASSIRSKHAEGMDMGFDAALRAAMQCGLPKPGQDRPALFHQASAKRSKTLPGDGSLSIPDPWRGMAV